MLFYDQLYLTFAIFHRNSISTFLDGLTPCRVTRTSAKPTRRSSFPALSSMTELVEVTDNSLALATLEVYFICKANDWYTLFPTKWYMNDWVVWYDILTDWKNIFYCTSKQIHESLCSYYQTVNKYMMKIW